MKPHKHAELIAMPDCIKIREHLTIGKDYDVENFSINGFKITADNGEQILILKQRFDE